MGTFPQEIAHLIQDVLAPDTQSPSGLIWKSAVANRIKAGGCAGTLGKDGYWSVQVKGKKLAVHRVLWWLLHGEIPKGLCIDHTDGNRGNNRPENLRLATRSQNNQNARKIKNRNNLPKGISRVGKRYKAQVQSYGKKYLMYSANLDSLSILLKKVRKELCREFSCDG
ncbi:HNH endonuclease [Rouxiella badensis]|uniref:HNH endonuclease n=1 Tax=Rouxiella badensis TaxID=1646377 RepID=UPI001D15A050|nr:HNH endonuclease [Rouxiella badensis]MCC3733501.1 HNH endonuclease [Rouxiella badensis]MCC3757848.1 HNH endonuclease [Rouxiella badensis]